MIQAFVRKVVYEDGDEEDFDESDILVLRKQLKLPDTPASSNSQKSLPGSYKFFLHQPE